MKKTSLYIHIPFCQQKCSYCDFYSIKPNDNIIDEYIDQLISELAYYVNNKVITIDTIYLGGGTPSLLPLSSIEKLTDYIYSNFKCEISEFTIETNPCSSDNIKHYKKFGINRLSLGVQSLDDNILKILGRKHDSLQALRTLQTATEFYDNISADLIIGVEKNQVATKDISIIKDCVKHISAYILKLEKGTLLYRQNQLKEFSPANDDQTAQQYQELYNVLQENGLKRYEISNFALEGYESKHNLKYWEMGDYIGIGASAHSFFEGKRYCNKASLRDYLNGFHIANNKHLSEDTDRLFETIMLGLRLEKGLDTIKINDEFNIDFKAEYQNTLKKIEPYVMYNNDILQIKPEYMLLQSAIAVEFL